MSTSSLLIGTALLASGCSLYFGDGHSGGDDGPPTSPGDPTDPGNPNPDPGHMCGAAEVQVIGMNQPTTGTDTKLEVRRPGHQILVLSAYSATHWIVNVTEPSSHVDAVYTIGYEHQSVDVEQPGAGAEIIAQSYADGGDFACGYSWPYNEQGCDTNQLLAFATSATGQSPLSFHGCYQATNWTLDADLSVSSNCDTEAGYEVDSFTGTCEPE